MRWILLNTQRVRSRGERRRRTTVALPVGMPRRLVDRNCRRRLHDAVTPTYRRHLRAYRRYFAASGATIPCGGPLPPSFLRHFVVPLELYKVAKLQVYKALSFL